MTSIDGAPNNEGDENEISADRALDLSLRGPGNDWFLQKIVAMANEGLSVGITLAVDGQVISGRLTSVKDYFRQYADNFVGSEGEVRDAIAALGERPQVLHRGEPIPPSYIHLKDARYLSTDGLTMPVNGMLWRGKINAVSGWSLGTLGPQE